MVSLILPRHKIKEALNIGWENLALINSLTTRAFQCNSPYISDTARILGLSVFMYYLFSHTTKQYYFIVPRILANLLVQGRI